MAKLAIASIDTTMGATSVTGKGNGSAMGQSRGGDATSMGIEKLIGLIKGSQIDMASLPLVPITRRLTVSNTSESAMFSSIQAAIDSITDAAIDNKYIVELITTDTFEENVVLKDCVYLMHNGFGQTRTATVTSSSGITITCPTFNSALIGFNVESTSLSASDAAVKVIDSSDPIEYFCLLNDMCIVGKGNSTGLWISSAGGGEAILYNTAIGSYGGIAAKVDNGILAIFSGATSFDISGLWPSTTIKATNSFVVVQSFSFANDSDGSGYLLDLDATTAVVMSSVSFGSSNVLNLANGSTAVMMELNCVNPPTQTPVTADATSILAYGSGFYPDGVGTATGFGGTGWLVDPATTFLPLLDLRFSSGSSIGTDQRPTAAGITPPGGTTFFATDAALGGGPGSGVLLYYIPGTGWIDFSGAVHV